MLDPFEVVVLQELALQEWLSATFPSVEVAGHRLHTFESAEGWEVWLNTEDRDFDGLCLAHGKTKRDVIIEARRVLMALTYHLGTEYMRERTHGR